MADAIYFEGGPRDGDVEATNLGFPPAVKVIMPSSDAVKFVPMGKDPATDSIKIHTETREYLRERAPHREGCVTYFWTAEDRDRAFFEDTAHDWDDYPTGMLPACQNRP